MNRTKKIYDFLDLSKDEEKLHDDDMGNQLKIVSLYDPMRADDFSVLQKSLPIRNWKSQNTPLTLESLKKIVLDLRNNLTISNKKENVLSKGKKIILMLVLIFLYYYVVLTTINVFKRI